LYRFRIGKLGKGGPKWKPKAMNKQKNKDKQHDTKFMRFLDLGVHAADPRFHSKDSYGRYILSKKMYSQRRNLTLKQIQFTNTIRTPFF